MDDAISRSAVLENIYEMDISDCTDVEDIIDKAYAMIADAPALNVAPVVRCADCKHRYTFVCPMYYTETYIGDLDGFDDDYEVDRTDDDGFCHLGERRDGEAE